MLLEYTDKLLLLGVIAEDLAEKATGIKIRKLKDPAERMVRVFWEVYKSSVENGRDMRTEAMVIAVKRVAEAVKTLGIWP